MSWFNDDEKIDRELKKLGDKLDAIVNRLDKQVSLGEQLVSLGDQILKAVQAAQQSKKAVKIGIHFQSQAKGEQNMPLILPVGVTTEKYYVSAVDADGDPGASLATGQLLTVASPDPSVVITPDASAGIDPATGVQSVASGSVVDGPTPVIGTAVTITATLTDVDGVTVLDTKTDTVTPAVGSAKKVGSLTFEVVTPSASSKR